MSDAIGVRDIDLDLHNFCEKEMLETESVLYIRSLRTDENNVDAYSEIGGSMGDIIGSIIGMEDLRNIAITAVAIMIKEQGLDIDKYVESLQLEEDENTKS